MATPEALLVAEDGVMVELVPLLAARVTFTPWMGCGEPLDWSRTVTVMVAAEDPSAGSADDEVAIEELPGETDGATKVTTGGAAGVSTVVPAVAV